GALASVAPGARKLEVRRPGHEPLTWTGAVRPGRRVEVSVALARAADGLAATTLPSERAADGADGALLGSTAGVSASVERPSLLYTWVLAGGAAVSTGLGLYFVAKQAGLESDLEAECDGATIEGRFVCRNPAYQSCAAFPDRDVCRSGRTTETATYVLFPLAGALAAGAVAAFFLEDGPAMWSSGGDAGDEGARISAGLVPLEGGVLGAVRGSY
ncbi:hypothetical protein L6R52_32770, partial [Myxococcota bacterium]|nr:hypothetical protein [Myxococcota bacterium]